MIRIEVSDDKRYYILKIPRVTIERQDPDGKPDISQVELSPRQEVILALVLEGKANKEIGDLLAITTRTVKYHVSAILAHFGVARRFDLLKGHGRK
jgi:DNA-binding NarL/FixJ family response regulator